MVGVFIEAEVEVYSSVREEGLVHLPRARPRGVDFGLAEDLQVSREVPGLQGGVAPIHGGPCDFADLEVSQRALRLRLRLELAHDLVERAWMVTFVLDEDHAERRLRARGLRVRQVVVLEDLLPEGSARVQLAARAKRGVHVRVMLLPIGAKASDELLEAMDHGLAPAGGGSLSDVERERLEATDVGEDCFHLCVHTRHLALRVRLARIQHEGAPAPLPEAQLEQRNEGRIEAVKQGVPHIEVVQRRES
mmetsp:Transcript_100160/g.258777  ORF Transcript_100160/g.258777 Transcript_100160/m.258777 type:complete len:249 (+) Transcript_100160:687-1433(+)